jgi:hypothetical protein
LTRFISRTSFDQRQEDFFEIFGGWLLAGQNGRYRAIDSGVLKRGIPAHKAPGPKLAPVEPVD